MSSSGDKLSLSSEAVQPAEAATTIYVGGLADVTTSGSVTTTTYYNSKGQRIALAVNGVFSYLGNDGLNTVTVALDSGGNPQASQLYAPYGGVRYSSGTMPGTYGFTGQHFDSVTWLDYYNVRYFDPTVGCFISADTVLLGWGLDPRGLDVYAYTEDNPVRYGDPTGHDIDPADWAMLILIINFALNTVGLISPNPFGGPTGLGVTQPPIITPGMRPKMESGLGVSISSSG